MALHSSELEAITQALGGKRVLRRVPHDELELVDMVREGLPYDALAAAMRSLATSREALSGWLGLPHRTIARRAKERSKLDREESEKLVRLIRIAEHAQHVFGSQEEALQWLRQPNRALSGRVPAELLDTDIGAQAVGDVLGRIEYGVYS